MPYNKSIEDNIGAVAGKWKNLDKKKMFGGICYLINGNMCFGIYKDFLIVRAGKDTAEKKLKEKHTKPFDITGKVMKGWVMVAEGGWKKEADLKNWLEIGKKFARSLPEK